MTPGEILHSHSTEELMGSSKQRKIIPANNAASGGSATQ